MILFEILRQPFNKLFKMYENQRQCDFRYLHYTVAVTIFEPFFSKCNSAIYIWHDIPILKKVHIIMRKKTQKQFLLCKKIFLCSYRMWQN